MWIECLVVNTQSNEKPHTKRQNAPGKTTADILGCVRPEWVNKWPNSMIVLHDDDDDDDIYNTAYFSKLAS
jgi:hypothetical protein